MARSRGQTFRRMPVDPIPRGRLRRPTMGGGGGIVSQAASQIPVRGLVWLGVRTAQFAQTVRLYRDVFGLQPFHEDPESVRFRLSNGTEIHVYGPVDEDHRF